MSDFRVKFVTKDGSLIQNRPADVEYYIDRWGNVNTEFLTYILNSDAREKGVRVVSYTIDKVRGVEAIVDWI